MKSFNSETFSSLFFTLAIPRGAFAPKNADVDIKGLYGIVKMSINAFYDR